MNCSREISESIKAHGLWKQRLRSAIDTGHSAFSVETVCQDNRCLLGRWLYSLDDAMKASARWKCVQSTHADFHREAARVLGLALDGERDLARAALLFPSKYAGLSAKLTAELTTWKKEWVRRTPPPEVLLTAR